MRWWQSCLAALACIGLLAACDVQPQAPVELAGATMGTSYSVKILVGQREPDAGALQQDIDQQLTAINDVMSTWDPESELMQLNRNESTDCIAISGELAEVIGQALRISSLADGSFDVTVGPLVNLWGFGPEMIPTRVPTAESIAATMQKVGYRKITLADNCLRKQHPDMFIDLSAIAKGYAVDKIAEWLDSKGYENYMVEIGGEVRARGKRDGVSAWKIGIEKPVSQQRAVQKIFPLNNLSLATSGDYRNYFEHDGVRYSHIIDANNGQPIRHNLVSVTVAHESCMLADALATAFMVLGSERAMKLAKREGYAIMAIVKQDGKLVEIASKNFEQLVKH